MPTKPFTFQSVQESFRRQSLTNADAPRYAPSGRSIEVPTVLNSVVGGIGSVVPVDGAGFLSTHHYVRANNLVNGWFRFYFGAGSTFGSGAWYMDPPVPPAGDDELRPIGRYEAFNSAGNFFNTGDVFLIKSTNRILFRYMVESAPGTPNGNYTTIASTIPWTFTVNDFLQGWYSHEAADGFNP